MAVGPEMVDAVFCCDRKACILLCFIALIGQECRYSILEVDVAGGKIEIRGVGIVGQDITLESKPVAFVFGTLPALFGKIPRFCYNTLRKCKLVSRVLSIR